MSWVDNIGMQAFCMPLLYLRREDSLLVLTNRVMRRPQCVETGRIRDSTPFLCQVWNRNIVRQQTLSVNEHTYRSKNQGNTWTARTYKSLFCQRDKPHTRRLLPHIQMPYNWHRTTWNHLPKTPSRFFPRPFCWLKHQITFYIFIKKFYRISSNNIESNSLAGRKKDYKFVAEN